MPTPREAFYIAISLLIFAAYFAALWQAGRLPPLPFY